MALRKESISEIDESIDAESRKKVEAALFIAGRFMTLQELVALTDVNPLLLKQVLEDLTEKYSTTGIQIVRKNDLWKMDVSPDYVWMVNRLATGNAEFTKAEQETLAIIAYKQPLKQSILVKIRGNKAYDHIAKFVGMGLIIKKKTGHTSELSLSDSFYDYFHINEGNNDSD